MEIWEKGEKEIWSDLETKLNHFVLILAVHIMKGKMGKMANQDMSHFISQ